MSVLELLNAMKDDAKIYREGAMESLLRNRHMNNITSDCIIDTRVIDAVLVDYINFVASKYCVDYGLYTKDLN